MGLSGSPGERTSEVRGATPAELEAAFEAILKSEAFSKAYAIRSTLRYLWEHRQAPVDEYSIAVHGMGRRPDFDPKVDSAVRVTMARLRAKLKEFYEDEGRACPLLLWIPRNGFDLEYHYTSPTDSAAPPVPVPAGRPWLVPTLAALLIIAVGTAAGAFYRLSQTSAPAAPSATSVPPFWARFLGGSKRVLLVLPDTLFLQWQDGRLSVGDSSVGAFSTWTSSPALKDFAAKLGNPTGWNNFISIPDTLANIRIVQYLETITSPVRVLATRDLPVDSFLETNVVLLGLPSTSYHVQARSAKLNFQIDAFGKAIRNLKPKAGEPAVYDTVPQTGKRIVSHGVLAVLSGRTEATRTLLLAGANTLYLAPMVSSVGPLAELDRVWQASGSPKYFEAVVETVTEGDAVLRIRLVAFRPVV